MRIYLVVSMMRAAIFSKRQCLVKTESVWKTVTL
jgi:hypothetical protein